jgi:hypothetical protein
MRQQEWDKKQVEPKDTYSIISDPEWLFPYQPLESFYDKE